MKLSKKWPSQSLCNYPACLTPSCLPDECLARQDSDGGNPEQDYIACLAAQLNQLLIQQTRQSMVVFGGDLIKAYLVLEIGYRHPVAQALYHSKDKQYPFSNIHSLAEATGIPRETVRRKIRELIATNWLSRLADGGLVICKERLASYRQTILPDQIALLLSTADKVKALQAAQHHR